MAGNPCPSCPSTGPDLRPDRERPGSLVVEDWLGTLTTTWLITDSQNLNLTVSGLDSRADDDSMHMTVFTGQAQYNWILGGTFLESVTRTLGLRGQYSKRGTTSATTTMRNTWPFFP